MLRFNHSFFCTESKPSCPNAFQAGNRQGHCQDPHYSPGAIRPDHTQSQPCPAMAECHPFHVRQGAEPESSLKSYLGGLRLSINQNHKWSLVSFQPFFGITMNAVKSSASFSKVTLSNRQVNSPFVLNLLRRTNEYILGWQKKLVWIFPYPLQEKTQTNFLTNSTHEVNTCPSFTHRYITKYFRMFT